MAQWDAQPEVSRDPHDTPPQMAAGLKGNCHQEPGGLQV